VATHLCQKIQKADFALNPKEAWSMVFKLMEGFQNHHKTKMPKNFKNKNGVEAKCDKDNANILNSPIYSLFNSGTEADPLALEDLPQYKVIPELDKVPSSNKITRAIKSMSNDKAPGESKLTTDMLKNSLGRQQTSTQRLFKNSGETGVLT